MSAWGVVDPILENVTPLHEYEANTWGPVENSVEFLRGGKVATKRFFDDHACALVAAGVGQTFDYGGKQVWRNSKVVKRLRGVAKRFSKIAKGLLRAVVSVDIPQSRRKYLKRFRIQASVLLKALAGSARRSRLFADFATPMIGISK
jgi:hypothetical protein